MKTYVSDLAVNSEIISYFLIVDAPQVRKSKKDADYWVFKLIDKTGEVDARAWEVAGLGDPAQFKKVFVKVRGMVGEWNDVQQVSVSQIRKVTESDCVDPGDFFERSEREPKEMFAELLTILDANVVNEKVLTLLRRILMQNEENFCKAPAARSVHHAFIGGLLEHVLDMCRVALPICDNYGLSKDLVLAGCIGHDCGKIFELSYDMGINYTCSGTLLGHISQGMLLISSTIDSIDNFPPNLKIAILHLVASHHGLLAYGSPKVPLMREAIVLNLVDLISAKMGICARVIKGGVDAEGMTTWCKELEGPLWNPSWKEE